MRPITRSPWPAPGIHKVAFAQIPRAIMKIASSTSTPFLRRPLVAIHRHSLRVPAEFAVGCWADGSTASVSTCCAALFKCKQLLGTEGLVVDLRCCFDQILEVGTGKEVSEVDEFAVVLVLNIDDSPSVLTSPDLLASHDDRLFRSDNSEGDNVLNIILADMHAD